MNIYDFTLEKLEQYFTSLGENKSKAKFLFKSLYKERRDSFEGIEGIKPALAKRLEADFTPYSLRTLEKCEDESASKLLFELCDGNTVESVVMKHNYGNGLCISSQIGCNMGCKFCESGRLKKVRNLTAGEMVQQILQTEKELGLKITHIVIMGIGEPFDNYAAVMDFIDVISCPFGLELGSRHITISTCGIVPRMLQYLERPVCNNLAISLHAPDDEIRSNIMPINKSYDISSLIAAAKKFTEKTNSKITFEYIMLKGINDSDECAAKLYELLCDVKCYVNIIPYNESTHLEFKKSDQERIDSFHSLLKQKGMWVTVRREFGASVNAACGQLRAGHAEKAHKADGQ